MAIFAAALYEALKIASIIGRIPRFWFFFLAAIVFLIVRRILVLFSSAVVLSLPGWWSTLDADGTPIIFSALLLLWVYDMRRSFQKESARAQSQAKLLPPEQTQPLDVGRFVAGSYVDHEPALLHDHPELREGNDY